MTLIKATGLKCDIFIIKAVMLELRYVKTASIPNVACM